MQREEAAYHADKAQVLIMSMCKAFGIKFSSYAELKVTLATDNSDAAREFEDLVNLYNRLYDYAFYLSHEELHIDELAPIAQLFARYMPGVEFYHNDDANAQRASIIARDNQLTAIYEEEAEEEAAQVLTSDFSSLSSSSSNPSPSIIRSACSFVARNIANVFKARNKVVPTNPPQDAGLAEQNNNNVKDNPVEYSKSSSACYELYNPDHINTTCSHSTSCESSPYTPIEVSVYVVGIDATA